MKSMAKPFTNKCDYGSGPILHLLVGLPGVGKSMCREFIPHDTVISTDDIIESEALAMGKTYSEVFSTAIRSAEKLARERFEFAVNARETIVLDRTNLTPKVRMSWISALPSDYRVICHVFEHPTSPEGIAEHQRRLDSRPGKSIPAYVMESMRSRFILPTLSEGIDEFFLWNTFAA